MPHIHTEPGQHDMTVSAYIVREVDDSLLGLVHQHKKLGTLMQIGGHIELDETPWRSMAHEINEESGYQLDELQILQPCASLVTEQTLVQHPVPFLMNTHEVGNRHYHSDLCYGFVARDVPHLTVGDGESTDLRWMTIDDMQRHVEGGLMLGNVLGIYAHLFATMELYARLPADRFSLSEPNPSGLHYRFGAPGEV